MNTERLEIARDGTVLGEFAKSEAVELLNTGFLRPTDQWRVPGSAAWQRLSELNPADVSQPSETWMDMARRKTAELSRPLAAQARRLGQGVRTLFASADTGLDQAREKFLSDYEAAIRKRVQNVLESPAAKQVHTAVRDEVFMRKVFGAAYDCLPKPICRFISEMAFVEFCLRRRNRLIGPVQPQDQPQPSTTDPRP